MELGKRYKVVLIPSVMNKVIRENVELVGIFNKPKLASRFGDVYTKHSRINQQNNMSLGDIHSLVFYLFENSDGDVEVIADKWIETYVEI